MALDLHRFESPNVTYVALDFPVFWEKAAGCWVTDVDGNTYLDMTAAFGVAAVGHSNPKVVAAIKKQSERLIHGMGDVHPSDVKVRLCERISNHVTPKNSTEQWQVILGQNGSDAVEAALKTARLATGKPGIIAFTGGYHGLSYGALNVTARSDFRSPFSDQLGSFVRHLPYGCDIDMLNEEIAGNNIGAVIVEPIQGRGGIVVPPRGWLAAVAACARSHGALFICDEIFTGWGRTGNWFAHRYEDVVPDIMCIGKAMGGGLPISACVAPESIISAWGESRGEALHTSTFLGNPLACAASLATISVMETEDLTARAAVMGDLLKAEIERLCATYPDTLLSVRGRGLMIGLQTSSPSISDSVMRKCLANGLIVLPAGDGSILEFVPPLIITRGEIETAVEILATVVAGAH
jgi:4-aminobutyrate aminotransferase-like enzyme